MLPETLRLQTTHTLPSLLSCALKQRSIVTGKPYLLPHTDGLSVPPRFSSLGRVGRPVGGRLRLRHRRYADATSLKGLLGLE